MTVSHARGKASVPGAVWCRLAVTGTVTSMATSSVSRVMKSLQNHLFLSS